MFGTLVAVLLILIDKSFEGLAQNMRAFGNHGYSVLYYRYHFYWTHKKRRLKPCQDQKIAIKMKVVMMETTDLTATGKQRNHRSARIAVTRRVILTTARTTEAMESVLWKYLC